MNPDNLSLKELIHYGHQHDDVWVKKMASALWAISFHIPEEYLVQDGIEEWFEHNEQEIKDFTWEVEDSNSTIGEQQRTIEDQEREIRALRLDVEERFKHVRENAHITGLKAALVELQDRYDADKKYFNSVVSELEKTQKAYHELKDKYNTWSVIAA